MFKSFYYLAGVAILSQTVGCGDKGGDSNFREKYESNLSAWEESEVNSYLFHYEEAGFTPLDGIWEIQVSEDDVIHVAYLGNDSPTFTLTTENAPLVDSLYESIKDCLDDAESDVTRLFFDEERFIPLEFSCSYGSEGSGFKLSEFQAL
jgi:hypothetical protein